MILWFREELIIWFVKMQLSDYDMLFHESLDPSWLDKVIFKYSYNRYNLINFILQVDRRYSWLKRTLLNYEEECSAIFPPEWYMPERICIEFCQKTKYIIISFNYRGTSPLFIGKDFQLL